MRYHVNPETGDANVCKAVHQCRFGSDSEHFPSAEAARGHFEYTQQPQAFLKLRKTPALTASEQIAAAFFQDSITAYADEIEFDDNGAAEEGYATLAEMADPGRALNNCFSASSQLVEQELPPGELAEAGLEAVDLKTLTFSDNSPHHAVVLTTAEGKRVVVDYTARQYLLPGEVPEAIAWPLVKEEAAWEEFIEERAQEKWGLTLTTEQRPWSSAKDAQEELRKRFPQVATLDLSDRSGGYVVLDRIVIDKENQKEGLGSQVMEALVAGADERGWDLALTPATELGATSRARLEKFYRRFGFVPNRGKHKDFSTREAMIRSPQK